MGNTSISLFIVVLLIFGHFLLIGIIVQNNRKEISSTWAWIMVLLFLPIVGLFIYFFLGRPFNKDNFYNISAKKRDSLKKKVDAHVHQLKSNNFYNNHLLQEYSNLLLMNVRSANAFITLDNEVVILSDGHEKFNRLFNDIRLAKKEINIQYYILQRDPLGMNLLDELIEKAKQGLKVRVLYDEIGSRGMSPAFFKRLTLHGGESRAFFPSILKIVNFQINHRNHRKLCIIDGEIAYIGGFNFGKEYLGLNSKFGYWRDTHLRLKGESVNYLQESYILDWFKVRNQPNPEFEQFSFRTKKHDGKSPIQIISSGPNMETENIKNTFIKLIIAAKNSIYIQTPYFIPDHSFLDACKMALLSGVDLRIMIPNKAYKPFVYWATWGYVGELLKYGAKILLYEKGFLHAKAIVVDQKVATVGTTNIDIRSFKLNFEVNALIYDKKVAEQLYDLFIRDSLECSELTIQKYNQRSLSIKAREVLCRLLAPIL